jgi:hypothetical protein
MVWALVRVLVIKPCSVCEHSMHLNFFELEHAHTHREVSIFSMEQLG